MGLVTKIFIVVMLVLALFATAVQVAIFAKRHQFQEELFLMAKSIAEKEARALNLEDELAKTKKTAEENDKNLTDKVRSLTDERDNVQAQNGTLKEESERLKGDNAALKVKVEKEVEQAARLNQQLHRAIEDSSKLSDELADAKRSSETNRVIKEDLERLLSFAMIERERLYAKTKVQDTQIAVLIKKLEDALREGGSGGTVSQAGSKGQSNGTRAAGAEVVYSQVINVQTDSSTGIQTVILNSGKKENIRAGMEFTIFRDQSYIGKVRIAKVFPRYSIGASIQDHSVKLIKLDDRAISSPSR